jgi:hypothetical protein
VIYLVPSTPAAAKPQPANVEELLSIIPYKRITDQIRRYWGKDYCDEYLNSLLINDREGDRQGFSPDISHAIFALITLNELMRRRGGIIAEQETSPNHDWVNETGRWQIVKSPETKKSVVTVSTSHRRSC